MQVADVEMVRSVRREMPCHPFDRCCCGDGCEPLPRAKYARRPRQFAALFAGVVAVATAAASRCYAQAPPPAPVKSAAPPAAPAPSAAIAAVIADAQAKVKAGQFAEAVAALTAAEAPGLTATEKQALDFAVADVQSAWGNHLILSEQPSDALAHLERALAIDAAAARQAQYAIDLRRLGNVYEDLTQYEKATAYYNQALATFQKVKNRDGEAGALNSLGSVYDSLNQYEKAISYYEQALTINREVKDRNGEAKALINLGVVYYRLSQYEKAIAYYEQALAIFQEVKDRVDEAKVLNNLGSVCESLNQFEKAIGYYEQALTIYKDVKDRDDEAKSLNNLGISYSSLSQYKKAITYYEQALPIFREIKDRDDEAGALTNLGITYSYLSQYENAITYYAQALTIFQTAKNRNYEANALTNLGNVYYFLSQYEKAIACFEQVLPIYREVKNRSGEAGALSSLGITYNSLSQYKKAVAYHEQALLIYREVNDRNSEASTLNNLGNVYDSLSQHEKAIAYYKQALPVFQEVKDRDHEANALNDLGYAYSSLNQYERSIGDLKQALTIDREIKDRDSEARVLTNLETAWANSKNPSRNPSLAILFGKQAVNTLQGIRSDIDKMDKATQKGFAKSKEQAYRCLAGLLIAQHRLPEALQVLDLFKQEEYLNFSKPAPDKASNSSLLAKAIDLTPRETRWDKALTALGETAARDTTLRDALGGIKQPTPQQKQQLVSVTNKVASDEAVYQKRFAELIADFRHKPDPVQDRLPTTSNVRDLQTALRSLGHGSVALYTLVTDKNIDLLLVTPKQLVAQTVPLASPADLNRKIAIFRAVLKDPYSDPRPLGKQLYDLLIAPICKDLDRAHAQTLLVALDGNLRYIPIAALSTDGKHYLVETYRTTLYTPAALSNLMRTPNPHWTALAMGVSQPHEGFKELNAVPGELAAVVRTSGENGPEAGLFPGVRLLDAQFNQKAMLSALHMGYPLVHIASHFVFTGDESTSFLLLGDGSHLTLSDLKALPEGTFAGVNLLTLSACDTATGGIAAASDKVEGGDSANGSRDVENVAVLAQRKGADAVLASLWSVNDASTGLLMRTFYRTRQAGGEAKVEALRHAQMALLTGGVKPPAGRKRAKRSELLSPAPSASAEAPAFPTDLKVPFAHPFYWAPFILIGNGK